MANDIISTKKKIKALSPSKNNNMYNSNMYWSQKPYNICDVLIEELSDKGDTIFDPFMGSGVTILEATRKKYGRNVVGCEINEAPLFLVNTLLKEYDASTYHKAVGKFIDKLSALRSYYNIQCETCGAQAQVTTTLFDLQDRKGMPEIKEINYVCPVCKRKKKTKSNLTEADVKAMNDVYEINYIQEFKLFENSKLAVYKDETIDQIFTKRNYKVLDEIVGLLDEQNEYTDVFRYVLMSVLHLCKITDTHSNSQWPLWIPSKNCVEKNIIDIYIKKLQKFEDTIIYLCDNYDDKKKVKLLHKGSQYITDEDIADGSINLIITDPPYLGQVAYSEYMQLYKPFLGLEYNLDDEIIVTSTPNRKVTEGQYFELLNQVFAICDKKMKIGGYFCMYFHDCNLNVWNQLIRIMGDNHFKYLSQEHIKKTGTLKNIISPKKSLSGDAILFFVKEKFKYKMCDPDESFEDIERNVIKQIVETVKLNGPQSTPELYDGGLIEYLVYNDWLNILSKKYKTLVEIFEKCLKWNSETNKWELREE